MPDNRILNFLFLLFPGVLIRLKRIVAAYKFTAEKAAYCNVVYLVERRIEPAHVVADLEQIVYVDDVFLAYLYETVVNFQESFFRNITLQA